MKKRWTALLILAGLLLTSPSVMAQQDRDEQMINASLRFIKENANLTKKEYEKFAKIYIEYNEQLVKLNRELKPESRDYMKRWQEINSDYMQKLDKALPDSTRQKVGIAQWELGQKVWGERSEQTRIHTERQFQMMGQWNQMNPQFMMQPHMYDFQRHRQFEMQQADEQQQQWWENYWRNWGQPDTAMMRRMQENRRRFESRDSIWQQRRQQFGPQGRQGQPFVPQGQQFPQMGQPGQFGAPGYGGSQFRPGSNR
ncbi:MAG: hypothetical protein IKX55_06380 [Bacteroidaceae bacterium]|nr:hypothetical protein [Bacteroidaceae bacterium]